MIESEVLVSRLLVGTEADPLEAGIVVSGLLVGTDVIGTLLEYVTG